MSEHLIPTVRAGVRVAAMREAGADALYPVLLDLIDLCIYMVDDLEMEPAEAVATAVSWTAKEAGRELTVGEIRAAETAAREAVRLLGGEPLAEAA